MHRILSGSLSVERLAIEIAGLPESLEETRLSEEMLAEAIATSSHAKPIPLVLTY